MASSDAKESSEGFSPSLVYPFALFGTSLSFSYASVFDMPAGLKMFSLTNEFSVLEMGARGAKTG
ncbi:MAG: hypothetical protein HW389_722 [Bacteroidetes bacterium]|nr:hypothetical protein [Bacteroidota bacterium]